MHCQLGVPAAPNTPTAAHPCLLPAGGDEAAGHPARDALRGAAVGRWGGAAAGAAARSTGAASLPAGASSPPGHRLAPTVAPTVCCRRAHRIQLPGKGQGSDAPHAGGTAAAPTKGPGQRPGKSPAAACACRKPTGRQPAAAGCRSTQSAATATYFCFLVDCSNPNKTSLPSRPTAVQVKEAKKICPDLVLVHVETIGNASGEGPSAGGGGAVAGGEQEQGHSRLTQKACLERYRCGCRRVPYRAARWMWPASLSGGWRRGRASRAACAARCSARWVSGWRLARGAVLPVRQTALGRLPYWRLQACSDAVGSHLPACLPAHLPCRLHM